YPSNDGWLGALAFICLGSGKGDISVLGVNETVIGKITANGVLLVSSVEVGRACNNHVAGYYHLGTGKVGHGNPFWVRYVEGYVIQRGRHGAGQGDWFSARYPQGTSALERRRIWSEV